MQITSPILIKARDAEKMLNISERTLWSQSTPRGPIPTIRINRSIRYRPKDLEAFAQEMRITPENH